MRILAIAAALIAVVLFCAGSSFEKNTPENQVLSWQEVNLTSVQEIPGIMERAE